MITVLLLAGALAGVLLSAFVSAAETGSYTLNRLRLRVKTGRREAAALRLDALMQRHEDLVVTLLLGNTLADYVATACTTSLLLRAAVSQSTADLYATAILTPVLLVFGGILPKNWFQRDADRLMYPLAGVLAVMTAAARLTGLVQLLRVLPRRLVKWIDPAHALRDDQILPRAQMVRLLHEGATRGGLSPLQRDLIDRVLNASRVTVSSVMIRRERCATVPVTLSRADFLRVARMCHFSRIPVWEGDPKNVIGRINVFDVITDTRERPIREYVQPVVRLSPTESVPGALLRMQQARQQMAIVVDRQGKCLGVLTLKDLVEELVGELENW